MIARDHAPDKIAALYRAAIERAYAAPDGLQATIAAAVGEQAPLPDHPDWQKQLLVDVSELVQGDRGSGIQRVVRNILAAWLRAPPPGYRVEPVAAAAGQAYRYARRFAFALLGGPCLLEDEIVQVAAGDCFLGLDLAPFVIPAQKDWLARLRATGVRTGFVVYDLLCVEMPDFFLPNAADDFARWLDCVSDADFALCISAAGSAGKAQARSFPSWCRFRCRHPAGDLAAGLAGACPWSGAADGRHHRAAQAP